MTLKRDAKFEEKLTFNSKYDFSNLVNFHTTTQMSQNFTLTGSFCPNDIKFQLNKYTRVISYDIEERRKV